MSDQVSPSTESAINGPSPAYGSHYFRHGCGVPYERNSYWLGFFEEIAEGISRDLHPNSVLDAGCAMGFLVEALQKKGIEASGIDISEYAISQVDSSVEDCCSVGSLTEPLPGRYDLIICIEVLEHLPPADTERALTNLCNATDQLLLSTTPDDYGEPTHLNVQPPETWSAALARQGFLRDVERDFSYISPWAALYKRVEEPIAETVRRYDRSWWRLRRENSEVRASLLKAEEKLARAKETEGGDRPTLMQQLNERDVEILRLRDLLIGRDAELGILRGRLAALEQHSQRLARLLARIPIPGVARLASALLRRLAP